MTKQLIMTKKPDGFLDLTLWQYSIFPGDEKYDIIRNTLYSVISFSKSPDGTIVNKDTNNSSVLIDGSKVNIADAYQSMCELLLEKLPLFDIGSATFVEFHLVELKPSMACYEINYAS